MKRIGVLTSGGDAPGMNAALRAVVRCGVVQGVEMVGIRRGYTGLIKGDIIPMDARSVANIIQRGGTVLLTDRCHEFMEPEGRARAVRQLRAHEIHGLVVIGGDGSFRGAHCLHEEHDVPVVGVPGTIDNDIYGTDWTIGFDTAVNNALQAIDMVRDTADAHGRLFLVEVMGRHSGFIALYTGIAGGAEVIAVPEDPTDIKEIAGIVRGGMERGKSSSMVVVCEGDEIGGAVPLAQRLADEEDLHPKVLILGHIQRGGNPTARDRILASRLGADAVNALLEGVSNVMCGEVNSHVVRTPLEDVTSHTHEVERALIALAKQLAV